MKKIIYLISLVCSLGFLSSCETEAKFETEIPENPVMAPLRGLQGTDGDGMIITGVVDQETKTVDIAFNSLPDLTQVSVKIDIPKRAKLVSPTTPDAVLDFSKPCQIVVNANGQDIAYTVNARLAEFRNWPSNRISEKRFANDCFKAWSDNNIRFNFILDGKFMSGPGKYDEIAYQNFQFRASQAPGDADAANSIATFSFDAGESVYLHKLIVHPYWFAANYQIYKYEVWGFCGEGDPSDSGDWSEWTKLGSFDYNVTPTVWPNGDAVTFDKGTIKKARYYRIRCTENFKKVNNEGWNYDVYSLCEMQISVYNKR